ncbi:hypothetical protein PT2222_160009 [Paraburkholderia tropica]
MLLGNKDLLEPDWSMRRHLARDFRQAVLCMPSAHHLWISAPSFILGITRSTTMKDVRVSLMGPGSNRSQAPIPHR